MARGWESKSVEDQIDLAEARKASRASVLIEEAAIDLIRKKDSLLMSRTRVLRDLESAQNPRYRVVLTKALAGLDAQLSTLAAK